MKKKKTLNDLISEYNKIESAILDNEGVVDQNLENMLELNNEEIGEKLNGYEKFIRHLKGQAQYLKDLEAQYAKKRKILEKSIDYYRNCMANAMEITGESNVRTIEFSFSLNQSEKWSIDLDGLTLEIKKDLLNRGFAENIFKPNIKEIKNEYKKSDDIPDWVSIETKKFIKTI